MSNRVWFSIKALSVRAGRAFVIPKHGFIVYLIIIQVKRKVLDLYIFLQYNKAVMKEKARRGRPPKDSESLHSEPLLVRLEPTEKEAFRDAAQLAGIPLSIWVRERLRQVAIKELRRASRPIPFVR